MSRSNIFATIVVTLAAGMLGAPSPAFAQWYFSSYTGGNRTRPASITIDQPAGPTSLVFHDVEFAAKPLSSPQFYGGRLGRFFGSGRWGLEGEFVHLKVISHTDAPVHVTGTFDGQPVDTTFPMNAVVQRYNMTHGLNFLLLNMAVRLPLWGSGGSHPAMFTARAGAGITRPGVDVIVNEIAVEGYQLAGPGAQADTGLDLVLCRRLSLLVDYKLTYATPDISISAGTGQMTALTHSITAGLAFRLSRR